MDKYRNSDLMECIYFVWSFITSLPSPPVTNFKGHWSKYNVWLNSFDFGVLLVLVSEISPNFNLNRLKIEFFILN